MIIDEEIYKRITGALLDAGYPYEEKGLRSGDSRSILTSGKNVKCIHGVRFSGDGLVFNMAESKAEVYELLSILDKTISPLLFCQTSFGEFNSKIKPFSGSVIQDMIRGFKYIL